MIKIWRVKSIPHPWREKAQLIVWCNILHILSSSSRINHEKYLITFCANTWLHIFLILYFNFWKMIIFIAFPRKYIFFVFLIILFWKIMRIFLFVEAHMNLIEIYISFFLYNFHQSSIYFFFFFGVWNNYNWRCLRYF